MRSLKTYTVLVAAVFVVLLVAAATVLVRQAEESGREQMRVQMLDTTRALTQVVDARLEGYEQLLRTLAASQALERRDFAALDDQARRALADPNAWVILADRQGNQLINTRLPRGAKLPRGPLPQAAWRELDAGKPRRCNLVRGLVEPHVLCVDWPIIEDGRARYALSVIFEPALLQRVIDSQHVPHGRFATIIDREGTVIWRNAAPERFVAKKATADLRRRLAAGAEGTGRSRSLEGIPTELAFSKSPTSGWAFVIAIPRDELAASTRRALRDGALAAAFLLLSALLVALAATRAVTGDIAKLRQAAQRLRQGDAPDFAASQFEEFTAVSDLLADAISQRDASRERFELAQDVGGIGAWEWDLVADQGRVSDSYKQMHGLAHVEGALTFDQVVSAVHPEDRDNYLQTLAEAKTRRAPSVSAYRVVHPDGSICWIEAKGRPLFDDDGRAIGAVGIVRDATAAHEAADALQRLNDLLAVQVEERTVERDRLWDIARDPFVVADADGVWLAASPAWSALLGYPVEELVGRTSEWMEHPDDIARTRAEDQRLADGHVTERFENRFRAQDGTYRWLSWTATPEGGRFYSVARDVTAEKEQAEALKKAEAALRQAQKMESIGQITGGVAHDFNNLLAPIVGTLDLLQQRGLPDPRSERMVANAIEAADRARMLVQRLLAFARRQPLQAQAVDVAACLRGIGPLLGSTLGPQVRLEWRLDEPLPAVTADANQLEMAILNLAVNARDAMPDGGVLTLGATLRDFTHQAPDDLTPGRYVELSVTDTGVGMPQTVIDRAIEPFFSTKGLGRGTGLGLSMVHGLMAQLGGGMAIDSAPGRGAQIRLWLKVADRSAERVDAERREPTAQFSGRVLLVDDEALVRSTSAVMLADFGYTVTEAASAAEALTVLGAGGFDLVVTDHLMPGMSGAELARVVRERCPSILVLIVSGYADVDDIAPDFARLAKPFRRNELADALARLGGAPQTP